MSKDKRYNKFLKSALRSSDPEQLLSPQFLQIIEKESKKRKIDPLLFFSNHKKYMKKIKY